MRFVVLSNLALDAMVSSTSFGPSFLLGEMVSILLAAKPDPYSPLIFLIFFYSKVINFNKKSLHFKIITISLFG